MIFQYLYHLEVKVCLLILLSLEFFQRSSMLKSTKDLDLFVGLWSVVIAYAILNIIDWSQPLYLP